VTPDELLSRYKPQLRYDSQEAFFADSAEEWTANPGNQLRRAGGQLLAEPPQLALSFLGQARYGDGSEVETGDLIGAQGKDYRNQYTRLREARPDLRNRIYGHAATDRNGALWLQYWFFYFYNDYHLALDFGLHEGDWEMVQIRMENEQPDIAVYAQHAFAEVRAWSEVQKTPDGRPLVYPGRGSHASYFEPGLYETEGWFDIADGKRDSPELALEIVRDDGPGWVLWPGFWGDTKAHFALDDASPRGPSQHQQWDDPAALLASADVRPPRTPPPPPELRVERSRGKLVLAFDFTHHTGGVPLRLVATVNSEDEPGVPPKTLTFDVEGRPRGELDTGFLLAAAHRYDVYTSVVSRLDGKEVPSASDCTPLAPGVQSKIPEWLKQPIWWLQRLFSRR